MVHGHSSLWTPDCMWPLYLLASAVSPFASPLKHSCSGVLIIAEPSAWQSFCVGRWKRLSKPFNFPCAMLLWIRTYLRHSGFLFLLSRGKTTFLIPAFKIIGTHSSHGVLLTNMVLESSLMSRVFLLKIAVCSAWIEKAYFFVSEGPSLWEALGKSP